MSKSLSFTFIALLLLSFRLYSAKSVDLQTAKEHACKLIDEGKYAEASALIDSLKISNQDNPALPEALYWVAERYRWAHKWQEAKALYQNISQNHPNSPYASRANLGIVRADILSSIILQDVNSAQQDINKILSDYPNHTDMPETLYWIARGFGYGALHEEEKKVYQMIVENYPDSPFAVKAKLNISRANVQSLIAAGKIEAAEKAIEEMKKDFSGHPDLQDAIYWIGARYEWTGRREEAMEVYQEAIKIDPNSSVADKARLSYTKTNILYFIGSLDFEDAKKALDKLTESYSGRQIPGDELEWIAQKYDMIGEINTADSMFEQIVQDSSSGDDSVVLAKAHLKKYEMIAAMESADKTKAQTIIEQLDFQLAGKSDLLDNFLLTLAQDFYLRGRNIQKDNEEKATNYIIAATELFDSIITKSNNGNYLADAYFLSGICYQDLGNYELAKQYFKVVAETWPQSQFARQARFMADKNVKDVSFHN